MAAFDLIVVQESWPRSLEQMGTKRKFWYKKHDGDEEDNEERWIFKYARAGTGEDWAEKFAEYLCGCLRLPHATYKLAMTWEGEYGVASPSFLRREEKFISGKEFLSMADPHYRQNRTKFKNFLHTVNAVMQVLTNISSPKGWSLPNGIHTANDIFVGYLMLDALIGNVDRHDENWGVYKNIYNLDYMIAPTYDHANSLGSLLKDEERKKRLFTKDAGYSLPAYASRGMSAFYESGKNRQLTPLEVFREVAEMCPNATRIWLTELDALTVDDFERGFDEIPQDRISFESRKFALHLLLYNVMQLRSYGRGNV
ncbi:HipA-like protein [Armatimonas sp.]|uniref:HipA-like protein n=1 Tax=Armatimonas sp. TaxID=1872638 RepID=UPI003751A879